jgi:hypothetical protein
MKNNKCHHCTTVRAILVADQLETERRSIDASNEDAAILLDEVINLGDLIADLDDRVCDHGPIPASETAALLAEIAAM